MAKRIEIRGVSDHLYSRLETQAALAGMRLPQYLLARFEQVGKPSLRELGERLATEELLTVDERPEVILRRNRDGVERWAKTPAHRCH